MALFKTFRGKRTDLDSVVKIDGHAYFCMDDGTFWIDYKDAEEVKRKQINKEDWTKDIEAAIAALKLELEKELDSKVDYLGAISSIDELSTIAGKGDYHRVKDDFVFGEETAHSGDLLIALIDLPGQDPEYWDLIHTGVNIDTLAPVAKSGLIEDLEMLWDTMLIFDGGDAGSHEPIALVGTTKLV